MRVFSAAMMRAGWHRILGRFLDYVMRAFGSVGSRAGWHKIRSMDDLIMGLGNAMRSIGPHYRWMNWNDVIRQLFNLILPDRRMTVYLMVSFCNW